MLIGTGAPGSKGAERIAVIGAGVCGLTSALALADHGYRVVVLEARAELFGGTSRAQSHRMHLGHHYPGDRTGLTARACIEAALTFEQRFPGFTEAHSKGWSNFIVRADDVAPKSEPWMGSSLIDGESFIRYCEQIRELYAQIITDRGTPSIFGPAEQFFRILPRKEYEQIVNMGRVELGVASPERVIRTTAFAAYLRARIDAHAQIEVLTGHEVIGAQETPTGFRLDVSVSAHRRSLDVRQVVNASWTEGPRLDRLVGATSPLSTVRLRFIVDAELPETLAGEPSMFFTLGEFGNYTNRGVDGRGKARAAVFYVPLCDADRTTDVDLPAAWHPLLRDGLDAETQQTMGRRVLLGMSEFVPGLAGAPVLSTEAVSVITRGEADINDLGSQIHYRHESGVAMIRPGWHSVNIAKFTFCAVMMERVARSVRHVSGRDA